MHTVRYFVMYRQNEWWITREGLRTGPHSTSEGACDTAVYLASTEAISGERTEVLLEELSRRFVSVYQSWTNDLPPAPVAAPG